MFCTKCGKLIPDDARFCKHCGAGVLQAAPRTIDKVDDNDNSVQRLSLRCSVCNGVMNINKSESGTTAVCPFCGSNDLITESEDVVIHRMRADAYRDVEMKRLELEERRLNQEEERLRLEEQRVQSEVRNSYGRRKGRKWTVIFMAIFFWVMVKCISELKPLGALIAAAQFGLFLTSYLIDSGRIKAKNEKTASNLKKTGYLLIIVWSIALS